MGDPARHRQELAISLPAYACAAANLVAVVALATVLAPGTTIVDDASRSSYAGEHLLAWRIGWIAWILAAVTLLLFYAAWTARVRAGWAPLAVAAAGFAADLTAETMLIVVVPDRPDLARTAFFLTGCVANGAYTVAGIGLSLRTAAIRGWLVWWTALMWLCGIALSVFAAIDAPLGVAVSTAALFALFLPWLIVVGRRIT